MSGGDRIMGWLSRTDKAAPGEPWAGLIVTPARIDGQTPAGRWDLRRRLEAAGK